MKNDGSLDIGITASCLFGRPDGRAVYVHTLLKTLAVIEKKDRFHLIYPHAPFIGGNHLDFRQHNVIDHRPFLFFNLAPGSDVFHDTCPEFSEGPSRPGAVITVRGIFSPEHGGIQEKVLAKRLSGAFAVIAPSVFVRDRLIKDLGIDGGKMHVIPEGITEEFAPQSSYRIGLARTRYALKRPYILFMGPLEDRKNLPMALEAYGLLRYEDPPDLVIAGEKRRLKENLSDCVRRLELFNSVKYIGYVPKKDLPALYSGAEALLLPSLEEGFGLPALEAMSCGTPVVLSSSGSLSEAAGEAGVYVDPENAESIADGLRRVLSGRRTRDELKQKCLERAKLFSAKRMASDTLKLYRKVAAK